MAIPGTETSVEPPADIVPASDGKAGAPLAAAVFRRKSLARLTLPLFCYAFLAILSSFVDQLLVSAYSQNLAAAVSMANQILGVAYDCSGLLGVGALILIAQHLGRQEVERARRIAAIAIAANTLLGAGIAAILFLGGKHFVAWANTPPEIAADTLLYIHIIGVAMIGNGFLMAAAAVLRGFGHTMEILLLGLLGNILYLFLEYALIFGRFGFPELGVKGAALSTLVVRGLGVVFLLLILKHRLGISLRIRVSWRRVKKKVKRLSWLSIPSVGDNIAYNLYQLTMVSFIAAIGVSAVLTRSYVLTLTAFLSLVVNTISQGNEILVGYDKGGGDAGAARRRSTRTALGAGAITTTLAAVLYLFSDFFIGLFTADAAVLRGAKSLLLINVVMQPFHTANVILFNSLRAVGDVLVPALYSVAVTWGLALPLGWLAVSGYGLGINALWWVLALTELVKWSIISTRWRRMRWRRYSPIGQPA